MERLIYFSTRVSTSSWKGKKKKKSEEDLLCWHELLPKRSLSWPQRPKSLRLDIDGVLKLTEHGPMGWWALGPGRGDSPFPMARARSEGGCYFIWGGLRSESQEGA